MLVKRLNAVYNSFTGPARVVFVYVVELFIYYVVSKDNGEEWNKFSWFVVAGTLVLIPGMFIYTFGFLDVMKKTKKINE